MFMVTMDKRNALMNPIIRAQFDNKAFIEIAEDLRRQMCSKMGFQPRDYPIKFFFALSAPVPIVNTGSEIRYWELWARDTSCPDGLACGKIFRCWDRHTHRPVQPDSFEILEIWNRQSRVPHLSEAERVRMAKDHMAQTERIKQEKAVETRAAALEEAKSTMFSDPDDPRRVEYMKTQGQVPTIQVPVNIVKKGGKKAKEPPAIILPPVESSESE